MSKICNYIHKNEIFGFCKTDETFVCEKCYELNHRGHVVEYLKILSKDEIQNYKSILERAEKTINDSSNALNLLNPSKQLENIKVDLYEFYYKIIEQLKKSYVTQIHQIHNLIMNGSQNLEKQYKDLSNYKQKLSSLTMKIEKQLKLFENHINQNNYKWFYTHKKSFESVSEKVEFYSKNANEIISKLEDNFHKLEIKSDPSKLVHKIENSVKVSGISFYGVTSQISVLDDSVINKAGLPTIKEAKLLFQNNSFTKTPPKNIHKIKSYETLKAISKDAQSNLENHLNENLILNDNFQKKDIKENNELAINDFNISPNNNTLYIDFELKQILAFHPNNNEFLKFSIQSVNIGEGLGIAYIDFGEIYFSGGEIDRKIQSTFLKIENLKDQHINLSQMKLPRRNHSSILLNKSVYVFGGYNQKCSIMKNCENYNIYSDKWYVFPELNLERNFLTSISFNCKFIYIFGGNLPSKSNLIEDQFEKIDITNSRKWEIINIDKSSGWNIRYGIGAIQISNSEIFLFGGINGNDYYTNCFILDTNKNSLSKMNSNLLSKEAFYQRNPIYYDGRIYCFGFWSKVVHAFDIKTQSWSQIMA